MMSIAKQQKTNTTNNTNISDRVYEIVIQIPEGKVTTYGRVAANCGIKNPRLVGHILHKNPDSGKIPCHRVVNFQGRLAPEYAFGGADIQEQKLKYEGVIFSNSMVDLEKCLWI